MSIHRSLRKKPHAVHLAALFMAAYALFMQCGDNTAPATNETPQYRFELYTTTRGVEGKDSMSILISDLPLGSIDCNGQPVLVPPTKPVATVNSQPPIPDAGDSILA
jgi:hypothetical protein